MVYDPDGHRVAQDDGVAAQQFVYDGNNLLQERDDMGTVEADYTYVPQEYARYVSQQREAESRFYHASGIQDVTQLTDAGEAVTDDYRFDAWGKPLATTGSTENPHTYKGEAGYQSTPQLSAEESTYYLHHRVLPSQGRFLSEDPLDDDANAYRYVRNNPVNAVDPSGLEEVVAGASNEGVADSATQPAVEMDFDPKHVPYDRIVGLIRAGMASFYRRGNDGVVAVYTSIGTFVFVYREESNMLLGIVETTLKDKYFQLITVIPPDRSPLKAVDLAFSKLEQARQEDWTGFLEFSLDWYQNLLPIYGAGKQLSKGDVAGAGVSLVGDIAMIASAGLASIGKAGRLAKLAEPGSRLSTAIHGTNLTADALATAHALQQTYQIAVDSEGGALKATGRGGEALLRLLGLRISWKQVKFEISGLGANGNNIRIVPREVPNDVPTANAGKGVGQSLEAAPKAVDDVVSSAASQKQPVGRPGNPDHIADVAKNNRQATGALVPQKVGDTVPDGVGRPGQAVTIRGQNIDPGNGRVLVESERFRQSGNIVGDGREQIRKMRASDPDATIVVTDAASPNAAPVIFRPGEQPPPKGRLQKGSPTHVPYP